jgi:hypothetical protein
MAARLTELEQLSPQVASAARAAREGGLDDGQVERVEASLGRLEAALRARSAAAVP